MLDDLQAKANEAHRARFAIEQARNELRHEKEDAFRRELAVLLEERFGAKLRDAMAIQQAADKAVADEVERIALSGENLPFPIGTVLVEWAAERWTKKYKKTGTRGVIEVITADSVHPNNFSSYSIAKRGTCVVRLLKKDGTPGAKYQKWHDYMQGDWLPDGVEHANAR